MIPECDADDTPMTPISASKCAASSPASHYESHQNQPHPLDLAGPGADPEADEVTGHDSGEATLSVQPNNLVTPRTLDQSVIPSSNIGPHPSEEVDASAARTAFSGIMVSTNCNRASNGTLLIYFYPCPHLHLIKMLLDIGMDKKQSLNQ